MKKLIAVMTVCAMLLSLVMAQAAGTDEVSTRVIDFDNFSLSHKQTWAGFKNNAGDYTDYIKSERTDEGKDGYGFKLTYKAATWYSGEVFCATPKEWAVSEPAQYIEFDAKGHGKIKIGLETGEVVNGTRYEAVAAVDSDSWVKISIPVTKFVKGTEVVPLSDVIGISFKAAEHGNLNNSATETKQMTADALEAKAVSGEIVIDNITLSNSYNGPETEPTATPTPTANPTEEPDSTTRIIDFDAYTLSHKQTWSGFKNDLGDYSDFIKSESADGLTGKGLKLTYKAATWYSGEVFCETPKEWAVSEPAQYIEFDAKGHGKIKIALETGEVLNGTRYEAVAAVDSDEWVKISIPVTKFVKGTEVVPLSDVIGISFKAAENGNLNNNATETKQMTANALEAKAAKGEVILDNIKLSESYTAKPKAVITVGEPNVETGKRSCKVSVTNASVNQSVTVAIALYNASGAMVSVRIKTETVNSAGEIYFDTTPGENELRIFVFDSLSGLIPLCNVYK